MVLHTDIQKSLQKTCLSSQCTLTVATPIFVLQKENMLHFSLYFSLFQTGKEEEKECFHLPKIVYILSWGIYLYFQYKPWNKGN